MIQAILDFFCVLGSGFIILFCLAFVFSVVQGIIQVAKESKDETK